jgi:eukaryotic-like serine/threonine-protein kinase
MTEPLDRLKAALADRYALEREIGAGGMATVYLARDLKHSRQVAIKVLRPELAATLGPERFVREIEIAAHLSHPHILPLHDSGEAEGILYYVMPYVEGESLRQRLDREGKLSVAESVRLTDEMASALSYAHEQGIVHRDVKPENILLSGGRAVVADFGIGRAVAAAGGGRLTGTGFAVGTPDYMSPEQAYGDANVDGRSDIYALGCVVFEMVSGRRPFEAETPQAVLARHLADRTPSLRTLDPTIPLFVERAVERALAKSPDDRFQTASEFAGALTSELVVARRGGPSGRRLAIAGVGGLGMLWAAVWGLLSFLGPPAYERLAVLPPTNLMNDPEQESLVQGMHDALISELQRAGIVVIARTSVLQYQNTQTPIREIARELGVDALIESSVFRAGDSVEMEVRLVDGRTQQLVADPITRGSELRHVLGLYRDLTRAIASEIHAALTPEAEAVLASADQVNPEAYEAYLRGRFHLGRLTPTDLDLAMEYFQKALTLDSTYAPAQAGVANVWWYRGQMTLVPPREAAVQASAAARQALAMDSTLAEVQRAVAAIRTWPEGDWKGAGAAYRKAIESNLNDAGTRLAYAGLLYIVNRPGEARAQIERALELDPANTLTRAFSGYGLYLEHRYTESIEELEAMLRLEPDNAFVFSNLASAYFMNGDHDQGLAMVRKLFPNDLELDEALDRGYAEGGCRVALVRYAETLAGRPGAAEQLSFWLAYVYAWAGEGEQTLEWLEVLYQDRAPGLAHSLAVAPEFDFVRDDPRFRDLYRRMDFPR